MIIKMYYKKEDCIVDIDPNRYVYGVRNNELVPVTFSPLGLDRTAKLVPWTFAKVKPDDLYFLNYTYTCSGPTNNIERKRCYVFRGDIAGCLGYRVVEIIDEHGWRGCIGKRYVNYDPDPDPITRACKMAMNRVYGLASSNARYESIAKERIDDCNRYFQDYGIPMQITNIKRNNDDRDKLDAMLYSYCVNDVINCKEMYDNMVNNSKFAIKEVKFNGPATVVFWEDGTKTVVKCGPHDKIDYEKGLAMAITKRALGDTGHYYETIRKYAGEEMTKAENQVHDDIWMAYQALIDAIEDKKATKADLLCVMEEAIGYLGEAVYAACIPVR